jgi:Family of unknown function (DUF5994)
MVIRWVPPATAGPPRLRMVADRRNHGALHGAWWPRGRDLTVELPAFLAALDAWLDEPAPGHGEHVSRVSMRLTVWDAVPARVDIVGRRVRLSWSGAIDAHTVGVTCSGGGHLDLLVIPPQAPEALAGAATALAVDAANTLGGAAILARTMPAVLRDLRPGRPWAATGGGWAAAHDGALRLLDDGDPEDTGPVHQVPTPG